MITNYFKIAWRNILKQRRNSLINLFGLAIGMGSAMILFLVVQHERSYDTFHSQYHNVYRVVTETQSENDKNYNPGTAFASAEALQVDMPQLKAVVPLFTAGSQINVARHGESSTVDKYSELVVFTTPDFFQLFDGQWLSGSPNVLSEPNQAVLDRETATRLFGSWENALGKPLELDHAISVTVGAVVADAPKNSDFPFHFLISFPTLEAHQGNYRYIKGDWNYTSSDFQTFILTEPHYAKATLEAELLNLSKKYYEGRGRVTKVWRVQPLSDIHFDTRYGGGLTERMVTRSTLTTLSLIGVFILVMAAINFINLSTAQAFSRGKEIGVRKVLGSSRGSLVSQSLVQTFILVLIALVIACAAVFLAMPHVHHLSEVPEGTPFPLATLAIYASMALVLMTLLSGVYPALILSAFNPITVLKSKINTGRFAGISLRKSLVVVQFALAQLLLIGTFVAVRQMAHLRDADLGFDQESLYMVEVPSDDSVTQRMSTFKQQLLQLPDVKSVSLANDPPSSPNTWASNFYFDGVREDDKVPFHSFLKFTDTDYFQTYGLTFAAGRGYQDRENNVEAVVNETMVKKLGIHHPEEIIGRQIAIGSGEWMTIVGVIHDFTPNSLKDEVGPITLTNHTNYYLQAGIKLDAHAGKQTLDAITKIYDDLYPEQYFQAQFLDETIAKFYAQEEKMAVVYQLFAGIAIVISGIGLYGMISFMLGNKVKEIGIRKVLGASPSSIVYLFSKEFVLTILVAFCIAAPVAYYFMDEWLSNFVYRIDIGITTFLAVILLTFLLAMLTVGIKSLRAAMANPVESLRDE